MTKELDELRRRVAQLELSQVAMRHAFEAAGQSSESQLATLNDVYSALFTAYDALKTIAGSLEGGDPETARRAANRALLQLAEYDPQARRVPFADIPAGAHFLYHGTIFRKYKNYQGGSRRQANACGVDDDSLAWFEEDLLVTLVD